jgi:hypothetical protein
MGLLETRHAKTADGFHVAYPTLGDGPTDVVRVGSYFSNLEHIWSNHGCRGLGQRGWCANGELRHACHEQRSSRLYASIGYREIGVMLAKNL